MNIGLSNLNCAKYCFDLWAYTQEPLGRAIYKKLAAKHHGKGHKMLTFYNKKSVDNFV